MGILQLLFQKYILLKEKEFRRNYVLKIDQPSSAFYIRLSYWEHQNNDIHGI